MEEYLDALDVGRLDADGNGTLDALTDGILILRQQFGFVGDVLVAGALGNGSTRVTGDEVLRFVIGEKIAANQDPVPKRDANGNVIPGETVTGVGFGTPEILDHTGGDPLQLKDVNKPAEDAVRGSSAWVPVLPEVQPDDSLKYSLDAYNQQVEFTSHVCEGQPIGLTADGSPNNGLLDAPPGFELTNPSGELNEEEIDEFANKCVAVPQLMALGVQTPLFLDAPDAAAYHFRVENGYTFGALAIDRAAADTLLIDPIFDLFLPATNEWIEVDLSQTLTLPNGTAEFDLYSRALPNQVVHRATNRVTLPDGTLSDVRQPAVNNFRVPFGFTFVGGDPGQIPVVDLDTVPRQAVNEPTPIAPNMFPGK